MQATLRVRAATRIGFRNLFAKPSPKQRLSAGTETKTIVLRNHGTVSYRTAPETPSTSKNFHASCLGGLMWWWIFWHLWTEPEHLTGEHPAVYPELWTDEELGIPPDSEGIGGRTQVFY